MAVLFHIVVNLAIMLVFLRFIIQLSISNISNPVVQACMKATPVIDFVNKNLLKPAKGRVNLGALLILVLLCLLRVWGLGYLGVGMDVFDVHYENLAANAINLVYGTLLSITDSLLVFCRWIMFGAIIASFISVINDGSGAVTEVIQDLAEPLFAPFRKLLPNMGMLDFSPLLALLVLDIIHSIMKYASLYILAGIY